MSCLHSGVLLGRGVGTYVVNFDSVLAEVMSETKYLEQLGFHVPEIARNVALQVRAGCIMGMR